MPGYLRLRLAQNLHQVADADFLPFHEIQQAKTSVVAESLKQALHLDRR